MERVETVIVGGGQAGLFTSYWLTQQHHDHVVLERAPYPAPVWRDHRWDSFTMVTPNWSFRLPGNGPVSPDPDGFLPREQVIDTFTRYVNDHRLPVRCNTEVTAIERTGDHAYRVTTNDGVIDAANVVIAARAAILGDASCPLPLQVLAYRLGAQPRKRVAGSKPAASNSCSTGISYHASMNGSLLQRMSQSRRDAT